MEKIILLKYGELNTKGDNRSLFINKIYDNLEIALEGKNVNIIKERARMYIEPLDSDIEEIVSITKNIFGIHSIVVAYKVKTDIKTIESSIIEIANNIEFNTFKVETDRFDKNFNIPSLEFSKEMGAVILKNIPGKKVDVHNPDYLLRIEIRSDYTYIYSKEERALGGYPVGVAGKGLLMLSGGIDSPVAGYLAMKRGIKIEAIYFESPPHTSIAAKNKVKSLVEKLNKYQPQIKLHIINFTEIQEAIYKNCNPVYMITIMRRMMYRIASRVMKQRNCLVLVNGESIGQVASQTLTSMRVINSVINIPVIRPVACLDKLEIIDIAKRIDTYDTSILPYEDCCTIFLPKHPVINPDMDEAITNEEKFDFEDMISKAVRTKESISISYNDKKFDI